MATEQEITQYFQTRLGTIPTSEDLRKYSMTPASELDTLLKDTSSYRQQTGADYARQQMEKLQQGSQYFNQYLSEQGITKQMPDYSKVLSAYGAPEAQQQYLEAQRKQGEVSAGFPVWQQQAKTKLQESDPTFLGLNYDDLMKTFSDPKSDRYIREPRARINTVETIMNMKKSTLGDMLDKLSAIYQTSILAAQANTEEKKTIWDTVQANAQKTYDSLSQLVAGLIQDERRFAQDKELIGLKASLDAKSPEKITQTQYQVATYADRIQQAEQVFNELDDYVKNLSPFQMTIQKISPNIVKNDSYRRLEQAQRNFINAVLRRESGAAISPSEFDNANRQYFPQPGDDDATLKQKATNRQIVLNGFIREAQGAYTGESPTTQSTTNTISQSDGTVWQKNADGTYTRIK